MWLTGPVAPRHVGSSQTRARTRVPCIGRQILNHCATREARSPRFLSEIPDFFFLNHPVLNVNHTLFLKKFLFIYLFIYGCVGSSFLCEGLPLVAASRGRSSSRCAGLSLSRPLLLRSTGSRRAGSVVVAHGPSRSAACGILPDQGSNPCALHWQADSQPLRHQGSPQIFKY